MFFQSCFKGRQLFETLFASLDNTLLKSDLPITHCILVDSSMVICWTSPVVILGLLGLNFVTFILFLTENPVSKHCRP